MVSLKRFLTFERVKKRKILGGVGGGGGGVGNLVNVISEPPRFTTQNIQSKGKTTNEQIIIYKSTKRQIFFVGI